MGVFVKSGNFWIDYYANGCRMREKVGPSKTLAKQALKKRQVEVAEGRFLDIKKKEPKIRFEEFSDLYAENYAKKKRSWDSTDKLYLEKLKAFFGKKYLHEIDSFLVRQYQSTRLGQDTYRKAKPSVGYINRELACLKCMFSQAIEWGHAKENPVKKIKFEKENNNRTRFLEAEELKRLLDNCHPKLRAIILVAVNTGMRRGEIRTLKWRDVDIQRGFASLDKTKNGEARNVPLNQTARETLMAIPKHPSSPYIFCNSKGNLYNFRASFMKALENAGISNFKFHDLRHTAASYLAMAGVDLNTIREILGHKSLSMVLRYAHLSKSHQANAVSILDRQMVTIWSPKVIEPKSEKKTEVASSETATSSELRGAVAKW